MQIERTTDAEFVRRVLTDPAVWPLVSDDYSGSPEEYDPTAAVTNPLSYYLVPLRNGERIGFFSFHPANGITYEMHSAIIPAHQGHSIWSCRSAIFWMFEHTRARKIITQVPVRYNRLCRITMAAGFAIEGCNRNSLSRGNRILDQWWMGIGIGKVNRPWVK